MANSTLKELLDRPDIYSDEDIEKIGKQLRLALRRLRACEKFFTWFGCIITRNSLGMLTNDRIVERLQHLSDEVEEVCVRYEIENLS